MLLFAYLRLLFCAKKRPNLFATQWVLPKSCMFFLYQSLLLSKFLFGWFLMSRYLFAIVGWHLFFSFSFAAGHKIKKICLEFIFFKRLLLLNCSNPNLVTQTVFLAAKVKVEKCSGIDSYSITISDEDQLAEVCL